MTDVVSDDGVWVEPPVDIHTFFNLTYANYLVLHRSLLQSMPEEWQFKFVALVRELQEAFDYVEHPYGFRVQAVDSGNRFAKDPIPHYNRGRTHIDPLLPTTICTRCERPSTEHLCWSFFGGEPPEGAVHGGPADFGFIARGYYCQPAGNP